MGAAVSKIDNSPEVLYNQYCIQFLLSSVNKTSLLVEKVGIGPTESRMSLLAFSAHKGASSNSARGEANAK